MELDKNKTWLSLTKASDLLGVHFTTLRRWADNGDIPTMLTAGGHRRFALEDLREYVEKYRDTLPLVVLENDFEGQALRYTRQEIQNLEVDSHDIVTLDEQGKMEHRALGKRLLGVMMQYLSVPENEQASFLKEAKQIGSTYATYAKEHKIPLREVMKSALFFKDALVEMALQLPETNISRYNGTLLRKINEILNEVQLAIVSSFEPNE